MKIATNPYLLRINNRRRFIMNVKIISAILVLAFAPLASMACGFTVNLPERAKAGAEVKESITVADPKIAETRVSLTFGAGNLNLSAGAENLVDGTALYNVKELKPEVTTTNGHVEIKQGKFENILPVQGAKNEWDLKLGKTPPWT
jgi:hypothetical protein